MENKIKQFPVLLTEEQNKRLAVQAGKEDVSKGEIVRRALEAYLKEEK